MRVHTCMFRHLLIFLISGFLGQVYCGALAEDVPVLEVENSQLDSLVNQRLTEFYEAGFWDAKIEIVSTDSATRVSKIRIYAGQQNPIQNIHILGVSERDLAYVTKEFMFNQEQMSFQELEYGRTRLEEIGYRLSRPFKASRDHDGQIHLAYDVLQAPTVKLDFLAAAQQKPNADSLNWFGHLKFNIPNLDGRGKALRLTWQRFQQNSENFSIRYFQPWIMDQAIKAEMGYSREVVEGAYQVTAGQVGMKWDLDWTKSLLVGYETQKTHLTLEGRTQNPDWESKNYNILNVGYRLGTQHRERKLKMLLKTTLGQQINFEPGALTRFALRSELMYGPHDILILKNRSAMILQNRGSDDADPGIHFPIGGSANVRGYGENEFRSPSVASLLWDMEIKLPGKMGLLLFLDQGMYESEGKIKNIFGYGLGVRLQSANGPLKLYVATHPGLLISNSYIHLNFETDIPWIDR